MLLRSCLLCVHHEVRVYEETQWSYCTKENCWSRYSKCLARRAIERFLEQDRLDGPRQFSAIAHAYERE